MIGECEDASQSLPPSHQRLTERIVGVTVHATVLSLRLSLRDSCCGGSDASYGEVGGGGAGAGRGVGELRTCHQQYCHNPR